ncbi:hypothetical protein E2562_023754 [Oryza meyeriana var. granulata]|uniref:Uncharacterized protein n=1 Tax=Oryza meyeriana var. granulata TaxID=110450 RepID=A0A6G1DMD1_9ORYZ|nr:hypothetical protein E2562_023754 [Oryza meyeriana var. granulata]
MWRFSLLTPSCNCRAPDQTRANIRIVRLLQVDWEERGRGGGDMSPRWRSGDRGVGGVHDLVAKAVDPPSDAGTLVGLLPLRSVLPELCRSLATSG